MKRMLLIALVTLLCICMLGSAATLALSVAFGGESFENTRSGHYTFDLLADQAPTFDTTIPAVLVDFTTDAIQSNFSNANTIEWTLKDGYTTFTATGGDPHVYFTTPPTGKPADAQYMLITYRTSEPVRGEFFCTRTSTGAMGSSGTNFQWMWNATGEWVTEIICCDEWGDADASDQFTAFRFDPLEQVVGTGVKVPNGATLDIKFAAFFKTEEEADGFDMAEYKRLLAYEEEKRAEEEEKDHTTNWPDPTYKEMESTELDMNIGTMKYTPSADGKTVTISYEVNGEMVSYSVQNNQNYLFGGYGATDDLDRKLYNSAEVGSYKGDERYVGLFYFLWHGEHGDSGVYDLQKIIDQVGIDAADNVDCGLYGPEGAMHWFAEPLYGYYYSNDAWIHRKHAELLTNANIDFLYFDVTNSHEYMNNALSLMKCLHELNEQGFDAPQVVFYTNSNAHDVVRRLYNNLYSKGLYEDTWFRIDGKPVIIAPYDANINDFFTIKQNQWPNDPNYKENGWPWMDFEWPQRVFTDEKGNPSAISVSIAQHSGTVCFSHSSLYNNQTNRGRSFANPDGIPSSDSKFNRPLRSSYKDWQANPDLTMYGLNFQAQFDHAIASDAQFILVTGWNEWVAQRQATDDGWIYFVDTASMEFSRDTEMMRGGYFDNYYIQLIYNVQKLKGTAPVIVQDSRKPINVTGEFDQWNDVAVTYKDAVGDTMDRDAIGFGRTPYTNTTGRNDIVASKVTTDSKNVYFYAETLYDVTMFDFASSWMQLYLDVDTSAETGWYGYDYIVNYQAKDTFTTTVAKYNGTDGAYGFEVVGEVSYRAKGNQMMIAVPQEMLGIEGYKEICFQFKWADSTNVYDEMEDFYCDGDVAPLGRLNYIYQNYIPGVSNVTYPEKETIPETETVVDPVTEAPTETPTEAPTTPTGTEAPTEADTTVKDKSCSSVMVAAVILPIMVSGAVVLRKRRED